MKRNVGQRGAQPTGQAKSEPTGQLDLRKKGLKASVLGDKQQLVD
jgi:hypothetical protein